MFSKYNMPLVLTAGAFSFFGTVSFADITAPDVMTHYQTLYKNTGLSFTFQDMSEDNGVFTVENAQISLDLPFFAATFDYPEWVLTENGDGSVSEQFKGKSKFTARLLDPTVGTPIQIQGNVNFSNFTGVYSGSLEVLTYSSENFGSMKGAYALSEGLDNLVQSSIFDFQLDGSIYEAVFTAPEVSASGQYEISFSGKADQEKTLIETTTFLPEGENAEAESIFQKVEGGSEGIEYSGQINLPKTRDIKTPEDFATWLDDGFGFDLKVKYDEYVASSIMERDDEIILGQKTQASDMDVAASFENGLLKMTGTSPKESVSYEFGGPFGSLYGINGPLRIDIENMAFDGQFPLRPKDEFEDLIVTMAVDSFTLDENARKVLPIDPEVFADPMGFVLDFSSSMRWTEDYLSSDLIENNTKSFVEFNNATLNHFALKGIGAELDLKGVLQFLKPYAPQPFQNGGPPLMPEIEEAKTTIKGTGLLQAANKLAEAGLIDPQSIMQFTMMGSLFGVLDAEADRVDAVIELGPNGQPIINGKPLPMGIGGAPAQ